MRVYQETSKMSEKKPDDELLNWMDFFRNHLDVGESTVIYKTLKENNFGTRMQTKLQTLKEIAYTLFSFAFEIYFLSTSCK